MEPRLQNQLRELGRLLARTRLWQQLSRCWIGAFALLFALLGAQGFTGWNPRLNWMLPAATALIGAGFLMLRHQHRQDDPSLAVARLEQDHPELRHLLSAASEQTPDPESGRFGFLQMRVIEEVLTHPRRVLWANTLERRLSTARNAQYFALVGFLALLLVAARHSTSGHPLFSAPWLAPEIAVTPGDTQVERGTGLVISARFGRTPPAEATLVVVSSGGETKQIPLARRLADPVFGASIPEVTEDGRYHIEYGSKKTRDYTIKVYEYPALLRADAELRYPDYTGLTNQIILDTVRVSAVEGTRLTYRLQLNKPVAQARLASKSETLNLSLQTNAVAGARSPSGAAISIGAEASNYSNALSPSVLSAPVDGRAPVAASVAVLPDFILAHNGRYTLELTDADGRKNKFPTEFILRALTNRPPELKLVAPRGDQRVSPIEELQLQAEATDDFGLVKYGIGFGVGGLEPKLIELGQLSGPNEKRKFNYLIPIEDLHVDADQLISYFVWADDRGPDGKPRRSYSDMFFAEVRPFEEIFRADQSGEGQNGNQSGNQGQGSQTVRLAEMQKQIVVATWKLQREKVGAYEK